MREIINYPFKIMLIITILSSYVHANDLKLLIYEQSRLRSSHVADSVEVNQEVFNLEKDAEVGLTLPNGTGEYVVVFDRYEVHQSGNTTWVGHVKNNGEFRIIVTYGDDVAVGMLQTPNGEFRLEQQQLLDMHDVEHAPMCGISADDELDQSQSPIIFSNEHPDKLRRRTRDGRVDSNEIAYVDLMVLYTKDMVEQYGESETLAILDNLIAISNQAYIDSQVHVRHRLVKAIKVNYQNSISPEALYHLKKGIIQEQEEIRKEVAADLVILLKTPFEQLDKINCCGIAKYEGIYSVVNYGNDCSIYVMSHEIGHNFGLAHEHGAILGCIRQSLDKNLTFSSINCPSPTLPYAHGYDVLKRVGGKAYFVSTIMKSIGGKGMSGLKFSNPDIECAPLLCGIAGYADSARVLNERRFFMENTIPDQDGYISFPPKYNFTYHSSFSSCYTVKEIPKDQCDALVALYDETDGFYWSDASTNNWIKLNNPCMWRGVTCENGNVVELARAHQNLTGTIPSEIGALTHLKKLYLDNNNLQGSIPDELGNLTQLEYLYLYNNQLTGNIPDLSNLTHLEYLHLSDNQLTENNFNFWNYLTKLKRLSLSNNNLSGNFPDLSGLIYLESLYLNDNNLCGDIPQSLTALTSLINIDLDRNFLTAFSDDVIAFLDSKYKDYGYSFQSKQTRGDCPINLTSGTLISDTISDTTTVGSNYYTIKSSSEDALLDVKLTNLSGDVDLYIKKGERPTASNKDCRSTESDTNDERCMIPNNTDSVWHIRVYGNRGVNYTINTILTPLPSLSTITSNKPISDSVSEDGWKYYKIAASSSHTSLKIELTNIVGFVDLYFKKDYLPSNEDHCDSSLGREPSCTVINRGSGTWNIAVYGDGYGENSYTLKATLNSNDISSPPDGNLKSGTTYLVPLTEELPHYYTIRPSLLDTNLHVEMTDLTTDLNLLVNNTNLGSECSSNNYFNRSEFCKFDDIANYNDTYDIAVRKGSFALTSRDSYKLTATLTKVPQRALLLLHGLNSEPDTWEYFEKNYYPPVGKCPVIFVKNGKAFVKEPSDLDVQYVDDMGVLCYKLHFGSYDNTPKSPTGIGLVGLEGMTCENPSCNGDYSTFSQLGKEVEDAVSYIIDKHGKGAEVILLGHSRGGLAARAYLQDKNSTYRENVSGLITTGTPHLGSPIGRIWTYLANKCLEGGDIFKKSSEPNGAKRKLVSHAAGYSITPSITPPVHPSTPCATDWKTADFIFNNSGLDVRSPSVHYLSDKSSSIRHLTSNVSNLPDHIFYKKIYYYGLYLGTLESKGSGFNLENNALTVGGGVEYRYSIFHLSIPFATQTVSDEAEKFILGEGKNPENFTGDGIVTKESQIMNFGKPHEKNIRGTKEKTLHIEETNQVGDLENTLLKLYLDLKWYKQ